MQPEGCQAYYSSPTDKEGQKLDVLGWKLYSSSVLGIKISYYETIMADYQLLL